MHDPLTEHENQFKPVRQWWATLRLFGKHRNVGSQFLQHDHVDDDHRSEADVLAALSDDRSLGTANGNWSVPAYSGLTKVVNGVTYYGYVTNYGTAIAPVVGTTRVRFNFTVCLIGSGERLIQTDAIVNGQAQQVITGVLPSLAANVTVTE